MTLIDDDDDSATVCLIVVASAITDAVAADTIVAV